MTKTTWKQLNAKLRHAQTLGEQIACTGGDIALPIDPFSIAERERPFLSVFCDDFGDAFDGQLEYHSKQNRFLAFVNSKYDAEFTSGNHHKRTRFSLGHELGHYFLESHRAYLMGSGSSHRSDSEFKSDATIEREADAFSSGLLMPSKLIRPIINKAEPSLAAILEASDQFQTSVVSTAIRMVQVTDFPCAISAIKDGSIAWTFVSEALIAAGCYPGDRDNQLAGNAVDAWENFRIGIHSSSSSDGSIGKWFRTYDRGDQLNEIYLKEEYLPAPVMNMVLVLLSVAEDDLVDDQDDY